jgi:heme/copper-type cytochrome/quinol oxidase subunit 3
MNEKSTIDKSKDNYGGDFHGHLLEQYKVVRSAIVDIQNDRNVNNRFLFAILTALLAVSGFATKQALTQTSTDLKVFLLILLMLSPILGIAVSWIWIRLNKTYHEGMRVRYGVLKDLEVGLPSSPFTSENERRNNYVSVSVIAIRLAIIFIIINILFFVVSAGYFIWFLFSLSQKC